MLRSAGFDVKDTDMMNAAAFEQFTKNAVAQVFDDVKAMGGRILVSEIEGLTKANPNARMTPEANRQLIARAMGAIDWADKYDQDYVKWRNTGNNVYKDKSLFTIDWMKQSENKLKPFQEARVKEMKVLGSANEPEKQSAGVPGPLLDIQSNGNLQRKGDLYRDKSTGIVYDKDGKQVQQ
jgi:hypothetical protein